MEQHPPMEQKSPALRPEPLPIPNMWNSEFLFGGKSQGVNLRDILIVVFKHRRKILATALLISSVALAAYFFYFRHQPPIYEAKALLMLRNGNEYVDANAGLSNNPLAFGQKEIITSEVLILSSRDLSEKLIDAVGLTRLYPDLSNPTEGSGAIEMALLRMEKDLVVNTVPNSQLITVAFQGKQREVVAEAVNKLIDIYQEDRIRVLTDPNSALFLESKVSEYYRKKKESEKILDGFKKEYDIVSFEEQMGALVQQRMNWESTLINTQTQVKQMQNKLAYLDDVIKKTPVASTSSSESLIEMRSRLNELRSKERELATKYTDKNRFLVSIREEINSLRGALGKMGLSETDSGGAAVGLDLGTHLRMERLDAQQQLNALEIQRVSAEQQIEDLEKEIQSLSKIGGKYQDANREMELNQQYYETYLNKLEEARISSDMQRQKMTSVSVVQSATVPAIPIDNPKSFIIFLAGGIGGGLAVGLGLAFLIELLGQGLTIPGDAEKRLRLPVLVTIPYR
jgi:uncharacterized protein involved in exopolysaccharide biosynthesis